uniref:N-acetyltransferase domain-containing protein n=1 Tax=Timema cristinae TaxID=61476 RepID=A0A7R9CI05_TIMCR|nr:unnamed protein product [Timema cristinae]
MQNTDAQANALIGQESAPKPPPPTERPHVQATAQTLTMKVELVERIVYLTLTMKVELRCNELGCQRLDFAVLNWNPAQDFYKKLGAVNITNTESWEHFRLSDEALENLAL